MAVYDGNDNLKIRFEYADGRMPYKMAYVGTTYYLAYDQAGTLKAVSDINGNVVKAMAYDTFGNLLSESNPAMTVPFGFAGGLYDKDTGLTRFGYRDYDAQTGKWTAKDPIGFNGGDTNLYGYVLNDPVNLVDPEGLKDLTLNQLNDIVNSPGKLETYKDLREFLEDPQNAEKALKLGNSLCPYSWFGLFDACGQEQIDNLLNQLKNVEECKECIRACGKENCNALCQ